MKTHLTGMAVAAGILLVVLLAVGVRPGTAVPWAATLACPVMMIVMMVMMRRGHQHHGPAEQHEQSGTTAVDEPVSR